MSSSEQWKLFLKFFYLFKLGLDSAPCSTYSPTFDCFQTPNFGCSESICQCTPPFQWDSSSKLCVCLLPYHLDMTGACGNFFGNKFAPETIY